jgi:hypothetical protein
MADHYCPFCGEHHTDGQAETDAAAAVTVVDETTRADVEIEKIRAKKEITLARIAAGMVDAERDEELAHAVGVAEGLVDGIQGGMPEPEPEPEPEPIVVEAPEPEPEMPPREERESGPRRAPSRHGFFG